MRMGDTEVRFTLTNYGTNEAFTTEEVIRKMCYMYTVMRVMSFAGKTDTSGHDHFKAIKLQKYLQLLFFKYRNLPLDLLVIPP